MEVEGALAGGDSRQEDKAQEGKFSLAGRQVAQGHWLSWAIFKPGESQAGAWSYAIWAKEARDGTAVVWHVSQPWQGAVSSNSSSDTLSGLQRTSANGWIPLDFHGGLTGTGLHMQPCSRLYVQLPGTCSGLRTQGGEEERDPWLPGLVEVRALFPSPVSPSCLGFHFLTNHCTQFSVAWSLLLWEDRLPGPIPPLPGQ